MNKKFLKFIVILLGCLIIIAFIATIYGINLKLNNNTNKQTRLFEKNFNINKNDKIIDVKIINNNFLLLEMKDKDLNNYYIIYDYKNDDILREIKNY